MSEQFTPPGSSTYSSDTLFVGDGTWDTQRNTFLLPNLMGLNFETMRYNGKLVISVELSTKLMIYVRHGKSIPRYARISLPDSRTWRHRSLYIPRACSGCNIDSTILFS